MTFNTKAAPVIYTNEANYLSALSLLRRPIIFENFEKKSVWAASRHSVPVPGSAASITSQGITWTSNYPAINRIATSNTGGNSYSLYSKAHGNVIDSGAAGCDKAQGPVIPPPCHQNDGLLITSEKVGLLYGIGGFIDSSSGTGAISKVTFLLDDKDVFANNADNINNVQRLGKTTDNWSFFGVIDEQGFSSAELRELEGKDLERVSIFTDNFTIAVSTSVIPLPAAVWLFSSGMLMLFGMTRRKQG